MLHFKNTTPGATRDRCAVTLDNAMSSGASDAHGSSTAEPARRAAIDHHKTHSAPAKIDIGRKGDDEDGDRLSNGECLATERTNMEMNAETLTSRASSPNSAFSRSETLVDVTAHFAVVNEKNVNPSIAERRLKFSEKHGPHEHVEDSKNTIALYHGGSNNPSRKTATVTSRTKSKSSKKSKTKGRKKSTGVNEPNSKLSYRNIYTGVNASGTTGSATPPRIGNEVKAMLGGPSLATGMIGCIVM